MTQRSFVNLLFLVAWLAWTSRLLGASTIQFSASRYTVTEGAGSVALTVQRTNDLNTLVTVDYASADGTATNGLKYVTVSGTLVFGAGEMKQDIVVPILNTSLVEGTQSFQVMLSNPANGAVLGPRVVATVAINDNDTGIQFESNIYSVAEDAGLILIGVVRGNDLDLSPFTVNCATSDETAFSGVDYHGVTNTPSFDVGETVKLFTIPILNDGLKEPSKTFRLTLSNPTGSPPLARTATAMVSILDNDPGVQFEFSNYWVQETEGALIVTVSRGNDQVLGAFTVDYGTTDGAAKAGQHYIETRGTLTFAQGEQAKTLKVPILNREQAETDKQFKLTLSNPTGGVVRGIHATATIAILDMTGMAAHRFDGITVRSDQSIQLRLAGGGHKRFQDYFDLYPIEVSTDLVHWEPLITLVRTNSSTNVFGYVDSSAVKSGPRFYRTVTNHLITPIAKPTGPFPVGVVSRMLTDPTRRNRYHISTNGSFMMSLWYPAVAGAGKLPDRLEDQPLAQDPLWPVAWGATPMPDREPYFVSHALPDAACAVAQAPYPVLIYSHGGYDGRTTIMERGPELASHGYVVVGVNHWDAFGTAFPDGTYLHGWTNLNAAFPVTTAGFQDRVRDLRFVLDQLELWSKTDAVFAGRMNLTNVATMGYSWGVGVAGEVARADDRCKAFIALDGAYQNADALVRFGLSKPFLGIYSDPIGLPGTEYLVFDRVPRDAIWFQIKSITHLEFLDYYWLTNPAKTVELREVMRGINTYTLWFLDKYLKGLDAPLPNQADYPRVINFKQK